MHPSHNTIKDPHWYDVQGSDTTMLPRAASLPGQKLIKNEELKIKHILNPLPVFIHDYCQSFTLNS